MKKKIEKSNVQQIIELSMIQRGMLYHYLKETSENVYNVQLSFAIKGDLLADRLEESLLHVQAHNETLRSVFRWEEVSKPVQIILKKCPLNFTFEDLSEGGVDVSVRLDELILRDQETRFDLSQTPFRAQLIKLDLKSYVLNITHHHILYDGWSTGILLKELFDTYRQLNKDEQPVFKLKADYQQLKQSKIGLTHESKNFWLDYLGDHVNTVLFTDTRAIGSDPVVEKQTFSVSVDALESFSKEHNLTKAALVYTAYGLLISKLSNSQDVLFGTVVSNRDSTMAGMDNTMGNFINTIPLRLQGLDDKSLLEVAKEVNDGIIARNDFSNTSYLEVKELLDIPGSEELFDSVIAIENYPLDEALINANEGFEIDLRHVYEHTSLPLVITAFFSDELRLEFAYKTELTQTFCIESLGNNLLRLLNELVNNPSAMASSTSLRLEPTEEQLFEAVNDTGSAYDGDETILNLFEKQVIKQSEATAFSFGDERFSYKELSGLSNQIASYLTKECAVQPGDLVGLMLEREAQLIPVIFGILKAGAAYVPIDLNFPSGRKATIIKDAGLKAVISRGGHVDAGLSQEVSLIDLDKVGSNISRQPDTKPTYSVQGSDLAYVIYTSGSTGKPKGVMIEHKSIVNTLLWMQETYPIGANDVLLQKIPIVFDVSVWELFWWSITGASVRLMQPGEEKNPVRMVKEIKEQGVTTLCFVPSMLSTFLSVTHAKEVKDNLGSLRQVFTTGEALLAEQVQAFNQLIHQTQGTRLINLYGPTEATVDVSHYECNFQEKLNPPIGKPVDNTQLYVLNDRQEAQPIGVPGELYIGGIQVARGYFGAPEFTTERFITNPITGRGRVYKTGDLVKWLPDGNIAYLGRMDDQVKIRGFRIELGEIENQLAKLHTIDQVAVLVREYAGDKHLLAYYTSDVESSHEELRKHLLGSLPEYMVPLQYLQLDEMPLTTSGKLNRKALPEIAFNQNKKIELPTNDTEERLLVIWSEVLKIDSSQISVTKSFTELGGHSLKIILMLNKIFKEFEIRLSINDVFKNPSIRSLSQHLLLAGKQEFFTIERSIQKDHYPLSSAQKRLFFLNEFDKQSTAYNGGFCTLIEGELDIEKLELVFQQLIVRHEVLRTSFSLVEEKPVQTILSAFDFRIEQLEARQGQEDEAIAAFIKPFDLLQAPLLRVGLIKTGTERHILLIDLHHIISDGLSEEILIKEFMELYQGELLPERSIHYKDYAQWQLSQSRQDEISQQADYWLKAFEEQVSVLDLPVDFTRPVVKAYDGNTAHFELTSSQVKGLRGIAKEQNTTMFTVFLSLYNVLLSRLSNQKDVVVGSPVSGRNHPDLEDMPGMFVNTLALRNQPMGDLSFKEFLNQVKQNTLQALEHQEYPYETLVDALQIERDVSRNPLFDVMFAYQNFKEINLSIEGLTLKPFAQDQQMAKFDLTFTVNEVGDDLTLSFEYATQLFQKDTINRFIAYFQQLVESITQNPDEKIGEVGILPEVEKNLLLNDFNTTELELDIPHTLVSAFGEVVKKRGKDTALIVGHDSITYTELNESSDQLSTYIRASGVEEGAIIGILLDRSPSLMVSILAVLKAGCAYVPLDPEYPIERTKYIAKHSGFKLLLTEASLKDKLEKLPADIHQMDVASTQEKRLPVVEMASISPDSLAYVIYTSGSTGKPKGVMVEHGNVLNFIAGVCDRIPFESDARFLALTTVSFDIFVLETLLPLMTGRTVVLASAEEQKNTHMLAECIKKNKVDALQITPSHLKLLLSEVVDNDFLNQVKALIIGGETLPDELLASVKAAYSGKIYNMYGPTETTVWSTIRELNSLNKVDVGKPIANTIIRIVGEANVLQPVGVPGELLIGGLGVARGYYGDSHQSAQKFITDPITGVGRFYRTGDLASWLPDGNIAYFGRLDNQVKINGFRIELGEIESQLLSNESISQAVVVQKTQKGSKFLVAYYVANESLDIIFLRSHLAMNLPAYMIPSHYMLMAELPLTPNGKIDRRALPNPQIDIVASYEAPVTEEEKLLANVWQDVLGIEKVGVTDNFFVVGGDSIKSIQIGARLRKLGYDIGVQDIFIHQTIRQLSSELKPLSENEVNKASQAEQVLSLESIDTQSDITNADLTYKGLSDSELAKLQEDHAVEDVYPLSPMQEGMLFHALVDNESGSYLGQVTCRLTGKLDVDLVEQTMNLLMKRHEILRTIFLHEGYSKPLQVVLRERTINFTYENHREACEAGHGGALIKSRQIKERSKGFDLTSDVLMRLVVLETKDNEYVLIWTHHHVLMDGWCMNIIMREFQSVYKQLVAGTAVSLPSISPYTRYIQWLEEREKQTSVDYWKDYLKDAEGPVPLPWKRGFSAKSSYNLKTHKAYLGHQQAKQVKAIAAKAQITPNNIFQLAWSVLVAHYGHSKQVTFGSVVSGRPTEITGIEDMMGLFINTIPVRVDLDENMSVKDALYSLQKRATEGVAHHYHSLSEITALLENEGDLFDHILTFQNTPENNLKEEDRPFELVVEDNFIQTNYDLSVTVFPTDELEVRFDYNVHRFANETIRDMASQLGNIIQSMSDNLDLLIKDIRVFNKTDLVEIAENFSEDLEADFDGLTIQQRLDKSFTNHADNTAIEYKGRNLSYAQLNTRASQIAQLIDTCGLSAGSFVGIYCEDRFELIASMLGVMKARMAFVPLETTLPESRLLSMIEQTQLTHVISDQRGVQYQSVTCLELSQADQLSSVNYTQSSAYELTDRLYAYFTSGSTGKPKGVIGNNRALSHFIGWEVNAFKIDETFRCSQFTNPGFDAFMRDILVPLSAGATVCIPDDSALAGSSEMAQWIENERISLIHCVPSIFKLFRQSKVPHRYDHLRYILMAGEKILPLELQDWYQKQGDKVKLVNLYGATETTLVKGAYIIKPDDAKSSFIPVLPMRGSQFMLLDDNGNICADGAIGEIYIRTPFMTDGYLNRGDLNRQSFIRNPFGDDTIYKTGDLGKQHSDGFLEILGRTDQQVKIRGVRIEPDEIKETLLRYADITEAVVTTKEDEAGEKFLCAYFVSSSSTDENELRTFLSLHLTSGMVPSYLIALKEVPLTANGKIDIKALPEPSGAESEGLVSPMNEVESTLAEIWAAVVGMPVKEVSTTSTFFEMGGHSLKLLLFVNRINKHFEVRVPIQEIFTKRTILELSDYLMIIKPTAAVPIDDSEMIEISL